MDPAKLDQVSGAVQDLAGRTVAELRGNKIQATGYDFHVRAVRDALLASDAAPLVQQLFDASGFKVVRLLPNGRPAQPMSFPTFDPFGLIKERWESSGLKSILENFFLVILQHPEDDTGGEDWDRCVLTGGFSAVPHRDAWSLIHWNGIRRVSSYGPATGISSGRTLSLDAST